MPNNVRHTTETGIQIGTHLPSFYNRITEKILFNKIYFCYISEIISSQTVPGSTNVWVTTTSAPSSSGTTTARPTRPTWRPKCCSQPRGEWARATSCKEKPSPGNSKWETGDSKVSGWKPTNLTSVFTLRISVYRCLMVLCWRHWYGCCGCWYRCSGMLDGLDSSHPSKVNRNVESLYQGILTERDCSVQLTSSLRLGVL